VSGPGVVEIRRRIRAPIAEVFDWWTQAEKVRQWMSPMGIAEVSMDLRVGGTFRIVMRSGDTAIPHTGAFIEIETPIRLVFTWVSPYTGPDPSLVTVDLQPDGENATQLRLVHSQLPSSVAPSHRDGWGTMLDRLAMVLPAKEVGAKWPSTS
jgi:uncharacterized protein YndB with AHSA1/START domain